MKGVGSHVQDLDQIPWQVRNLWAPTRCRDQGGRRADLLVQRGHRENWPTSPGSGTQEREFGLKERQLAQSERQSSEANAIAREKIGVEREQNQIAADPRKFRLQPHVIDLGRGGTAVYDPETGMVQQVTPREPGDVRGIGRDIYVPAGQTVNAQYGLPGGGGFSAQISGGPYNGWVPTRNTPGLPFGASGGPAGGYQCDRADLRVAGG
jgi:hypothetical protein